MKKKTFTLLDVYSMNIDDLYRLVKSTCNRASVVSRLYYNKLHKTFFRMQSNNDAMGVLIKMPAGKNPMDELTELNLSRILTLKEIAQEIQFYLHHHDTNKKKAAGTLHHFFSSCLKTPIENSTFNPEICPDIIVKYHTSLELFSAVAVLGISVLFSDLEIMNDSFKSLSEANFNEIMLHEKEGMSLKPQVIADYLEFCHQVEEIINFVECPEINSLFVNMDELRKSYQAVSAFERKYAIEPLTPETNKKATGQLEVNLST